MFTIAFLPVILFPLAFYLTFYLYKLKLKELDKKNSKKIYMI